MQAGFMKRVFFDVIVALPLLVSVSAHAAAAYSDPVPFDRPGFASTQPWDINDAGVIVGVSDGEGFIYSGGAFTSFNHPDAAAGNTFLTGIANDGTLFGGYFVPNPDPNLFAPRHGFIYSGGAFTTFDVAGATSTLVRHASSDGRYLSGTWDDSTGATHGFVFDRQTSVLTDLTPLGDFSPIVQGVNVHGQVTGSFLRIDPVTNRSVSGAFVYDLGTQTRTEYLDVGGLLRPRFRDINDQGLITGFVGTQPQAFVGTPGDWQVFSAMPGGTIDAGYGLNNNGMLVGWTSDTVGTFRGWISSPVPEPGTWALWLLGLVPLAVRARRGRHH